MSLTDKFAIRVRQTVLGAAVAAAPFAEATPSHSSQDTPPDPIVEQAPHSDDLGLRFDVLREATRSEKFYPRVNSTEQEIKLAEAIYAKPMDERKGELDRFLVKNYDQLKVKFASDWAVQQAQFPTIKVGDTIPDDYYRAQDRFNSFNRLSETVRGKLEKKERLGTISQDEMNVLKALGPTPSQKQASEKKTDLYNSFVLLEQEAQKGGKEAQENYADFLITSYSQLKKQLTDTGNTDANGENEKLKNFDASMQDLYQSLAIKQEKGLATETEKRVLTAISNEDSEALAKLKQDLKTYPETNPVDQPSYNMFSGLMTQLDHQQELCHIHPGTRLGVAEGIMEYGKKISKKTDYAKIGWAEINPNKLHQFLKETGSHIDATNGLQVVLNHPTDKDIGFTLNMRQEDIARAAKSGQEAYNCIKGHIDPQTSKEMMGMIGSFASAPTPENIQKMKENFGQIIEKYQDRIPEDVREEFESHIKQAAGIPFELNVRDKNGTRKATKEDADLFLTTLVANTHALDEKGVINLNDIVSYGVGKDSSVKRGLTSFAFGVANIFGDPVRSAMEEPVKKAFYSMIETRDKNNLATQTNRDILMAHSSPISMSPTLQGTTLAPKATVTDDKKPFDIVAVAKSGGRG